MSLPTKPLFWQRNKFVISTDKKLISVSSINHAFGEDFMYWTKPLPEDVLQNIIDNSYCFGLYEVSDSFVQNPENGENGTSKHFQKEELSQIGFARLITDKTTFAYLTDLYVLPTYQGLGLGGWLIDCVNETLSDLPYLRWIMLRTSSEKSKQSYEQRLGMMLLKSANVEEGPVMMGKKGAASLA